MKTYLRTCLFCNKDFQAKHKLGKFCQKSCRYTHASLSQQGNKNPKWKEKIKLQCSVCHKEYEKFPSQSEKSKFCSCACAGKSKKNIPLSENTKQKISDALRGENSPHYGKKWSPERRKNASDLFKTLIDDEWRERSGRANRGKKFDAERIHKLHGHRSRESYIRIHSEETKSKIGKQSSERFLDENYKKNIVEKSLISKETSGKITRRENLDDWKFYWIEAGWLKDYSSMWYLAELGQEKLKEFGVFCPKTNINGCVRDHIVGRKFGFDHRIFPELLRHPRNCQILTNRENNLPEHRSNNLEDIDILFDNILSYDQHWPEQELCVGLIQKYRNGERWVKNGISDQ